MIQDDKLKLISARFLEMYVRDEIYGIMQDSQWRNKFHHKKKYCVEFNPFYWHRLIYKYNTFIQN